MPGDFAIQLRGLIAGRYASLRAFIRAAEPTRSEDTAVAYLSKVLKGTKPPPLERIEAWAEALALRGEEREDFIIAANLLHAPPMIRDLVDGLRGKGQRRAAQPKRPYTT